MVSRGYIQGWADRRGRVDVLDLQGKRGYFTSIENATVVGYVYDPGVLSHDLEAEYGQIESAGVPVIAKLRSGADSLSTSECSDMVAFLDMHLDRGRYADQAKVRTPAVLVKTGGALEDAQLTLGDRLLLAQAFTDVVRLAALGLEQWKWQVLELEGLATGDGAVLLWRSTKDSDLCTVSFPLSPTRLLVIGHDLPNNLPINLILARNCKRWLVGAAGTLNLNWVGE
ncbi:hypothetical protein RM52_00745 [Microbacterium hominis]|uniref:DUF4238 domain-containing protein n=2 Tax=Microbacterium hominis TaxID=162426 RepID=A0A0B4E0A1_9MICO|nr:hypothetical protein RM52_00745 [Microbacterium hominis]